MRTRIGLVLSLVFFLEIPSGGFGKIPGNENGAGRVAVESKNGTTLEDSTRCPGNLLEALEVALTNQSGQLRTLVFETCTAGPGESACSFARLAEAAGISVRDLGHWLTQSGEFELSPSQLRQVAAALGLSLRIDLGTGDSRFLVEPRVPVRVDSGVPAAPKMTAYANFSLYVEARMQERKLSLRELMTEADLRALNKSPGYLSKVINGSLQPDRGTVLIFAAIFRESENLVRENVGLGGESQRFRNIPHYIVGRMYERGLSRAELSREAGIDPATLRTWIVGAYQPHWAKFAELATFFGDDILELDKTMDLKSLRGRPSMD